MDLALNNLQRLICHKTQPTQPTKQPTNCIAHSSSITESSPSDCLVSNPEQSLLVVVGGGSFPSAEKQSV